jgi:MarR family transcriptional regulator, lower aerobic nicotinate degradation pathway regulator
MLAMATDRLTAEPEVAEFAGQLLFRLWRASHTRTAAAFESVGLTTALFAVLNYLGAHPGETQRAIGTAMGIDPSTMVSLIDDLQRAGLASRRPHPNDRRAHAVTITAKGRRALERARTMAHQVEDEVLGGLSAGERRELLELMRRALDVAPPQPPWSSAEGD